jgi:hypothetical protein
VSARSAVKDRVKPPWADPREPAWSVMSRYRTSSRRGSAEIRRAGILGVLLEPTTVVAKAWELVAALEGNHREVRWNPETHLPEGPVTLLGGEGMMSHRLHVPEATF